MDQVEHQTWKAFCTSPCEETFQPLYETTKKLVFTICYRFFQNEEEALDAFQSTYARMILFAKTEEARAVTDAAKVVSRLTVREADRLLKKKQRRVRKEIVMEELPPLKDTGLSADQIAHNAQIRERVETLVSTLPDRFRIPVQLYFFHGMTHQEIADAIGKSRRTVISRIEQAFKRLHPMMRRAGLGEVVSTIAAFTLTSQLLSPPSAVGATAIFAKASATAAALAAGGAAAATATGAATTGSLIAKTLSGAGIMKAKAVVISTIAVIIAAGLLTLQLTKSPKQDTSTQVLVSETGQQRTTESASTSTPILSEAETPAPIEAAPTPITAVAEAPQTPQQSLECTSCGVTPVRTFPAPVSLSENFPLMKRIRPLPILLMKKDMWE